MLPTSVAEPRAVPARPRMDRWPFYYGWVIVVVAALAMVATLPGRTHGLGMITERLLSDLQLDRVAYATMNLWATLLGAVFCLPVGALLERWGTRAVLTGVVLSLAAVVLLMGGLSRPVAAALARAWPFEAVEPGAVLCLLLFVALTLTRGLGQSALSVVSLALVGKWFVRRLPLAMGFYSVLVALGFMAAFRLGKLVRTLDWQTVWAGMGLVLLLGMAPLGWLLVRSTPEGCGLAVDGRLPLDGLGSEPPSGHTLGQALRTPAFWVFGLASSLYGLISSGIALFNEAILKERGFDAAMYYNVAALTPFVALLSNFGGGWLAGRWSIGRLLGLAMLVLTAALVALPQVRTEGHVYLYAVAMGMAGGIVTVVFFAVWGHAFGRAHLGKIQGVAQMLTVLASALGPLLLAACQARYQSYVPMFYALAGGAALAGVCAWWVPVPRPGDVAAHALRPSGARGRG